MSRTRHPAPAKSRYVVRMARFNSTMITGEKFALCAECHSDLQEGGHITSSTSYPSSRMPCDYCTDMGAFAAASTTTTTPAGAKTGRGERQTS